MDSITHVVLGAAIGEAFMGRKVGKRSMFYGAILHSLPDIDFVAAFWLSPADNLLAHRGITHSFLFCLLSALLLAWLANQWYRSPQISLLQWVIFFGTEIFLHIFLDAANVYGTGWLEPFSHQRFSYNTLFVVDPVFAIAPTIAFVVLLLLKSNRSKRIFWTGGALLICTFYFLFAFQCKRSIDKEVEKNFVSQQMTVKRYFTTPTALNSLLWFVVAESDSGFYTGYRSVFDEESSIHFTFHRQQRFLLHEVGDSRALNELKIFSQGYYTIDKVNNTIVFNDLRFGQVMGWSNAKAPFVFHYYLQNPEKNLLVIQRGRLSGWNREALKSLWYRMWGREGNAMLHSLLLK